MIEKQLFVGLSKPEERQLIPPLNVDFNKPAGGLWTSSYIEGTSAWVEWCKRERFRTDIDQEGWVLTPSPTARILTINTLEDLQKAVEKYPHPSTELSSFILPLNFEAIAEDYDAMRLTEAGQWATRLSVPNLYGWDMECTVWFRWVFEEVEPAGSIFIGEEWE